ncbi:MAG: hypothetical protein A3D92_15950 [Bacteroidetes bacterium RIFCSPHIGHO2_02_FULL_44_7]|nr:MAG: hypothetical protein A3D92_15950 [Bacteroidetes bacterium RIFCSPHIGHO2_02_FULL_44_7]
MNRQLKCLIVEDEKLAQDVLKKYISQIPSLYLIQTCNNASEAIAYLHSNAVDLIFLDINMPELNGIEFLKTLQHSPSIIITTAYSEYALDGYEYSVCDYLLKPIRYERFLKAINKVMDAEKHKNYEMVENSRDESDGFIFIKEEQTVHKLFYSNLLYIQAFGNYLKIFTVDGQLIVSRTTLTDIEAQLPNSLFIRVHKSYLVAIQCIEKIKYNEITISGKILPLGTTYKQEVLKKMRG